jgi:hypothetical protein
MSQVERKLKPSKKKSVETTRFLKCEFNKNPNPGEEELSVIQEKLFRETQEFVDLKKLRDHFQEKRYRERKKLQNKLNPIQKQQPRERREKSDHELTLLRQAWIQCGHVCPSQNSDIVKTILAKTLLTYNDVSQWFGQQRHILKSRHHESGKLHLDGTSTQRDTPLLKSYYGSMGTHAVTLHAGKRRLTES